MLKFNILCVELPVDVFFVLNVRNACVTLCYGQLFTIKTKNTCDIFEIDTKQHLNLLQLKILGKIVKKKQQMF